MDIPHHDIPDTPEQRAKDRGRALRAFNLSLATLLLLVVVFFSQENFDARIFSVQPRLPEGLWGILTAPFLHGSIKHLATNAVAILMLGTLTGSVFPRATLRSLPLIWFGAGLGAWLLGQAGQYHLGASGITHGLGFLVFALGLIRRDRAAIAAGMLAFLFYGGMMLSILPQEPGVSWQSHLGGALGGLVAAILFRHADPVPPRKRYSWELEEEAEIEAERLQQEGLELERPEYVPVIWHRVQPAEMPNDERKVISFRHPDSND
ncbi:MAG: rhomboid family intramembrane serine protease [Pseudomonadota bacterium]|nr:rhomboid family intramembrane serine protease [Pseudomonadota bacterium]